MHAALPAQLDLVPTLARADIKGDRVLHTAAEQEP